MKHYLLLVVFILSPMLCLAEGLFYEQISIGQSPQYAPIQEIRLSYKETVKINNNARGYIYCGNDIVAEAILVAENITIKEHSQGWVVAKFDEPLILPTNKRYIFCIHKDAVASTIDKNQTNAEVDVEFYVPNTIGELTETSIDKNGILSSDEHIALYWSTETKATSSESFAYLYREGEQVRIFPLNVTWDWDLGQAYVDFGGTLNFEKDVKFSLIIPKGAISSLYRDDIINDEIVVDFVGGYTNPLPAIDFIWCSLFTEHPTDELSIVSFIYDKPIKLSSDPEIQLWLADKSEMLMSVVPTLNVEENTWVLEANFKSYPLTSNKGYTIIIPEGTLISDTGDIVVNGRKYITTDNSTKIYQPIKNGIKVSLDNRILNISGLSNASMLSISTINGQYLNNISIGSDEYSLHLPYNGIYILKIDSTSYKILVR